MKAIIVDDELAAREILSNLLKRFCEEIEVVDLCESLEIAVSSIRSHNPDIVFLDVEMPKYAGYEITQFFDEIKFNIVFVTAYDQYAIKAFEVAAIDYLLKPIEIDHLKRAIEKVKKQIKFNTYKERLEILTKDITKPVKKFEYIEKGFRLFVPYEDIVAFKAQRAYTCMILKNQQPVILSKTLKVVEKDLTEIEDFIRIHRSWIINLNHIERYSKTAQEVYLLGGKVARVSRVFKASLEANL